MGTQVRKAGVGVKGQVGWEGLEDSRVRGRTLGVMVR